MFLKDPAGNWYEVPDDVLKGKAVDEQRAREALATERAEKRKKIVDMISGLDADEMQILRGQLGLRPGYRVPVAGTDSIDCNCDCGDCNCDCSDCNCDCSDCNCDCSGRRRIRMPRRRPWSR